MNRPALRVLQYRLPATMRRRWSGYVALALLIGLLGGVAMASVAAGRRTQSAFSTYLASTNPSDLTVSFFSGAGGTLPDITGRIAHLPGVLHADIGYTLNGVPLAADGAPELTAGGANETGVGSLGLYLDMDRATAVAGRLPIADRPDEIVITTYAAQQLGVHVGAQIPFGFYSSSQANEPGFGAAAVRPVVERRLTVVGLVDLSGQIVQDDVDSDVGIVVYTPALTRVVLARAGAYDQATFIGLQLAHGDRSVTSVEQAIVALMPAGAIYNFHLTSGTVAKVERAVRPESIALGMFGLFAALALLVIATLTVARLVRSGGDDLEVLRAFGADPLTTVLDSLCGVLAAVVVGAALAAAVATALSPLAPFGPVRPVYPDLGVDVDWTVVGSGVLILIAALGVAALAIAVRNLPQRADRRAAAAPARASTVAAWAAAVGAPAPGVVGLLFALDPGRGRRSAPVRSAMVGSALAVMLVVTTLTFGSGLQTLVSHPALYGWNWDDGLESTNNIPPQSRALLNADPLVAGWIGYGDNAVAEIDGLSVPVLIADTQNTFGPPLLAGRQIAGPHQILLGAATLRALGKHVGDTVTVSYGDRASAPVYVPPTAVTIVGEATLPAVGQASFYADHPSMGIGGVLSHGILPPAFVAATGSPDPTLDGPDLVFIRFRPGVGSAAARADLERIAAAGDKAFNADPAGRGNDVVVLPVQRPAEIVNYRSMGLTPAILAGLLAAGAVLALALTLAASVRRRRRDIALLKTLGFTGRQVAATVAWQASVAAIVGVAFGVPVGIATGRGLWTRFAEEIYAVPRPTVPVVAVAVVVVATLIIANAVAAIPGRAAARTRPGVILRAE